jgi:hypothetical protein
MSTIVRRDQSHRQPSGFASLLVLSVVLVVAGCGRRAAEPMSLLDSDEGTLAQQAEFVRAGLASQIRVDHALVRDDDLKVLDDLESRLLRINLSRTEVTDAGFERLCHLTNLEQLRLSSPHVTDAGLAYLKNLEKLRFLHLLDSPITDTGLDQLHGLKSLESVYLDRTHVTDEGIARLLEALPKVHLHLDDHHHPLDSNAKTHQH